MPRRKDYSEEQAGFQRTRIEFKRSPKTCGKCKQTLHRSAFHKDASALDGLNGICKTCRSLHAKNTKDRRNEVRNALRRNRRILSLKK
jgi:hypothetical protein